jgi:hypothetical protein
VRIILAMSILMELECRTLPSILSLNMISEIEFSMDHSAINKIYLLVLLVY